MAHIGGLNTENDNANINNILTSNGIDEDKSNRNSINSKNDLISELILAALCAKGRTTILNAESVDRGYESVERELAALGADVKRLG